jgi:hypothetical protein
VFLLDKIITVILSGTDRHTDYNCSSLSVSGISVGDRVNITMFKIRDVLIQLKVKLPLGFFNWARRREGVLGE